MGEVSNGVKLLIPSKRDTPNWETYWMQLKAMYTGKSDDCPVFPIVKVCPTRS